MAVIHGSGLTPVCGLPKNGGRTFGLSVFIERDIASSSALLVRGKWQSQGREVRHFTSSKLEMVLFVSISSMLRSPTIAALVLAWVQPESAGKVTTACRLPKGEEDRCVWKIPSCGLAWHNSPEIT